VTENKIDVEVYAGKDAEKYTDLLAQLRISEFKEYPYLYSGNIEAERKLVAEYAQDEKGMIVVAKINGKTAGLLSGIPLVSNAQIVSGIKAFFEKQKVNINEYYYCGEGIILPEFRHLGLIKMLLNKQDEQAKKWQFKYVCALTVFRDETYFPKPKAYTSTDSLWTHLGFIKTNLRTNFIWPTIQKNNSIIEQENTVEFWTKTL
jgi:hypothetical protein